ncbi:hypothetical protein PC358_08250 [Pseudomonas capeferrum]|nr:hypothetical protein PC358_08250 [Pseudomonas capeferrum]
MAGAACSCDEAVRLSTSGLSKSGARVHEHPHPSATPQAKQKTLRLRMVCGPAVHGGLHLLVR